VPTARLAQLAEHLICNQEIPGSNPGAGFVHGEHDFAWRDGERTIVFREGGVAETPGLLAGGIWERFELLTTPRALRAAPLELAERASAVHEVSAGAVPEAAAAIIDSVRNPTLVALGGGRVIDSAKAIAAVRGGRVCAVPTTLSGAEMTTIHRLPAHHEHEARHLVRPVLVIADPLEMTTLDDLRLRASAMNSLAHGAEALYTPLANPVTSMAALRAAELLSGDLGDRSDVALGALLAGYASGSTGIAVHHAVCQMIVRLAGTPHAETNAVMLPHSARMMAERVELDEFFEAVRPATLAELAARCGHTRLSSLGVSEQQLPGVVEEVAVHPYLANTPDPPGPDELLALLRGAL
jgi:alcohol dehydrogenase class IV